MSRFLSAQVRTRRGRGAGCGTGGRRSGPGRARRPGFRAPPRGARIVEGRSATASPSPSWGAPVTSSPHTGKWRRAGWSRPGFGGRPPRRGSGSPARPLDTSSLKMVRGAGGGGGGARGGRPPAWGVAVYRRGGASAGAAPGGEASGRGEADGEVHASVHVWAATRCRSQGPTRVSACGGTGRGPRACAGS